MFKFIGTTVRRGVFLSGKNHKVTKFDLKNISLAQKQTFSTFLEKQSSLSKKNNTQNEEIQENQSQGGQIRQYNSVTNENLNIVHVRGLPLPWGEKDITSYFDKYGQEIQKVNIVKNRIGVNTGRAMITFRTTSHAEKFIQAWDHNLIESSDFTQQIAVQMFTLKKREDVSHASSGLKQIYIYNLSFDCESEHLYELARDFGEVRNVELPKKSTGKNKGFGFVTFERAEDAENFLKVVDEMDFMGRNIRATLAQSRYEGKNTRKETYSNLVFKMNQTEEDVIKGENLKESMKLYEELKRGGNTMVVK